MYSIYNIENLPPLAPNRHTHTSKLHTDEPSVTDRDQTPDHLAVRHSTNRRFEVDETKDDCVVLFILPPQISIDGRNTMVWFPRSTHVFTPSLFRLLLRLNQFVTAANVEQ